jgi:AraC-like DNA-binding protein
MAHYTHLSMNLTDTIIPVYNLMTCSGGTNFGIARCEPDDDFTDFQEPHRNEGYSLILLTRGAVSKFIDFEKYYIEAPALISMSPEQVHQWVRSYDAELLFISFNKDFLMGEMQGWMACWECMFGHVIQDMDTATMDELQVYARLMEEEFAGNKPQKDSLIRNLLNAFIICCARLQNDSVPVMQMDSTQNKLVRQFKYQVDTHFREKTMVAEYADMLYVTPGHLNEVIKTTVGKTAKQVIDEKRLTEAKRLLFWGNYSMKEIAWQLKFEDDSYFNRFFKKHTGHTPFLYQRTIREKYN